VKSNPSSNKKWREIEYVKQFISLRWPCQNLNVISLMYRVLLRKSWRKFLERQ